MPIELGTFSGTSQACYGNPRRPPGMFSVFMRLKDGANQVAPRYDTCQAGIATGNLPGIGSQNMRRPRTTVDDLCANDDLEILLFPPGWNMAGQ